MAIENGVQIVQVQYGAAANAVEWNKRHSGIVPVGVYQGGFLMVVSGHIEITPLVAEIKVDAGGSEGLCQFRVETTENAILDNQKDYDDISGEDHVIVCRLTRDTLTDPFYAEFLVLTEALVQDNDIILGVSVANQESNYVAGCSGFTYSTRTVPDVVSLQGLVQAVDENYVLVNSCSMFLGNGLFLATSTVLKALTPRSKKYTLYLDLNGTVQTEEVVSMVPRFARASVAGAINLAQVTVPGSGTISSIHDLRQWLRQDTGMVLLGDVVLSAEGELKVTIPDGINQLRIEMQGEPVSAAFSASKTHPCLRFHDNSSPGSYTWVYVAGGANSVDYHAVNRFSLTASAYPLRSGYTFFLNMVAQIRTGEVAHLSGSCNWLKADEAVLDGASVHGYAGVWSPPNGVDRPSVVAIMCFTSAPANHQTAPTYTSLLWKAGSRLTVWGY